MTDILKPTINDVAVIGASCTLPGANSPEEFWNLLQDGRNTVSSRPRGRWNIERFLRPGSPEPGFAYTFAGGYLDHPFAFDPAPFGISPREAQQIDPQQRLLLEVVWKAIEDAGYPASALRGQNVGVYVGASNVDYQNGASHDVSVMESHFMTGNSLSILSNRISYIFDLHGPSFTVDSACSSSFSALAQALVALRDGEIDVAVVAGVNMLLSPIPFIGFSQARMLSPSGLARPFSSEADGYVRSEGAVALVLKRLDEAQETGDRVRSIIVGASVNSDGRTSGISLPSFEGQRRLIEALYAELGVDANELAFVEAHGTGTLVGDPIEATAIGTALGQKRNRPLVVGSAKSNVGHLESASGLVGFLKASLALENAMLPRSVYSESLNPSIDFDKLNLKVAQSQVRLDLKAASFAGVCNYGFGGTNAHVVLRASSKPDQIKTGADNGRRNGGAKMLVVSAAEQDALQVRAAQIAHAIEKGASIETLAAALAYQRDIMPCRVVLPVVSKGQVVKNLRSVAGNDAGGEASSGIIASSGLQVAFVFSGNGGQFADMGRAAYLANAAFRREIDAIDNLFRPLAGWSIRDKLKNGIGDDELAMTSISQPLIFAVQSALNSVLAGFGIRPRAVVGHSVGEVAAAESCGALSRRDALHVIIQRSNQQEAVRGKGRMLVVAADEGAVRERIAGSGLSTIEVAALNSPASTTVAGPVEDLRTFARNCRKNRIATIELDIDYPFHSSALDPLKERIPETVQGIQPRNGEADFLSTVKGGLLDGSELGPDYWWHNIRSCVRFEESIAAALERGSNYFVEIGPRPVVTAAMTEIFRARGSNAQAASTLSMKDNIENDPITRIVSRLIANGVDFDKAAVFGPRPAEIVSLPSYPFRRQDFILPRTSERLRVFGSMFGGEARHPLLGARMADGSPEWRNLIDPVIVPYLNDHRVDGGVIVPAAGLIEMALAAGRDLFGEAPLEVDEFDVAKALAIGQDEIREVSTRFADNTGTIEIWSRKRFSGDEWLLHARGLLRPLARARNVPLPPPVPSETIFNTAEELYEEAARAGLEYGPLFQLVHSSERDEFTTVAKLDPPKGGLGAFDDRHVLNPMSLDAAFHGLFISRPQRDGETKAHLPVRFRKINVWDHGATIRRTITHLTHETDRFKTVSISLLDAAGTVVASVEAAVLRAVYLSKATVSDRTFCSDPILLKSARLAGAIEDIANKIENQDCGLPAELPKSWLLTRAFSLSLAYRISHDLMQAHDVSTFEALRERNVLSAEAMPYLDVMQEVLAERGALQETERGTALVESISLPPPETLLATLMQHFPDSNVEVQLAATALEQAPKLLETGQFVNATNSLRQGLESVASLHRPGAEVLKWALERLVGLADKKLRVIAVQPWNSGLLRAILPLSRSGVIELTFASKDKKSIEQCRREMQADSNVSYLHLGDETRQAPMPFDLLVGFATSEADGALKDDIAAAVAVLAQEAPVLLAVPASEPTLDLLCGLWSNWLKPGVAGFTRSQLPPVSSVEKVLRDCGFADARPVSIGDGLGHLVTGSLIRRDRQAVTSSANALFYVGQDQKAAGVFGLKSAVFLPRAAAAKELLARMESVPADATTSVYVFPHSRDLPPAEQLAERIETLKSLFEMVEESGRKIALYVITEGANSAAAKLTPVEAGIYAFVRVAINEYPGIDIRLIDVAPGAGRIELADILEQVGGEREFTLTKSGLAANRVRRGMFVDSALGEEERSVLQFSQPGRIDSFEWVKKPRLAPGPGDVEIEVAAAGLNYRDILVGLGILDDDLLGAGLTGAALGFECSGTVVRVGEGVENLKAGDRVMGFASGTLASHIVTPAWHFFHVPAGMALEAAATVPVAFATAWYSLVERANIRRSDSVLIHGAAGGVGLAATQIAKRAGARVIGTASNDARRAIARAAGADLTYDSRRERFVEPVRNEVGGVDVVLNSLSGSAMAASFNLVKPFGRFIELGKRDFLDNTHLGLRPFVRNIMYSGVDLDEFLAHDRPGVERMMATLSDLFERGELRPLPYQVYASHEVGSAFRSMQASEHIGKIVIQPARQARPDISSLKFAVQEGVYLIVGGTAGLGFATAQWLAAKGASTLVLASRRGQVEEALAVEYEKLRRTGVRIIVESLDVLDSKAVGACVERITSQYGPMRGVVHAAVQLDDGLISGLEPERLRAVLRTKVDGAINLDKATQDQPLDFFVVYSSATTVIGSPGQSAYVAANAFLEGFARQRRAAGKPALAIGWGAISDVGIIARDQRLGQRLRRTTGVVGIRSSEALAHLGRLLQMGDGAEPVQFYTNIAPSAAANKLALINSPAFAALDLARHEETSEEGGDLTSAIAGKSQPEAHAIVMQALRREMAHILRMSEAQIDALRPLTELGFDSLMALELHMSIEKLSGTQVPMVGTGDRNLNDLAGAILQQLTGGEGDRHIGDLGGGEEAQIISLAGRHSSAELSASEVRKIQEKISSTKTR